MSRAGRARRTRRKGRRLRRLCRVHVMETARAARTPAVDRFSFVSRPAYSRSARSSTQFLPTTTVPGVSERQRRQVAERPSPWRGSWRSGRIAGDRPEAEKTSHGAERWSDHAAERRAENAGCSPDERRGGVGPRAAADVVHVDAVEAHGGRCGFVQVRRSTASAEQKVRKPSSRSRSMQVQWTSGVRWPHGEPLILSTSRSRSDQKGGSIGSPRQLEYGARCVYS